MAVLSYTEVGKCLCMSPATRFLRERMSHGKQPHVAPAPWMGSESFGLCACFPVVIPEPLMNLFSLFWPSFYLALGRKGVAPESSVGNQSGEIDTYGQWCWQWWSVSDFQGKANSWPPLWEVSASPELPWDKGLSSGPDLLLKPCPKPMTMWVCVSAMGKAQNLEPVRTG